MTDPTLTDDQLLFRFARSRCGSAFATLVDRHAGWVFGVAYRGLKDRQLAEDATQTVFIYLARAADKMNPEQRISGWLFLTTGRVVKTMRRSRVRRQRAERLAFLLRLKHSSPQRPDLSDRLDDAVASLPHDDQSAILLRFYQGLDFGEIAASLHISQPAARKRVSRAVAKLRRMLSPHLSRRALRRATLTPAPSAAVVPAITAAALANLNQANTAPTLMTKRAIHFMRISKLKAAAVVALALLAGSASYSWLRPAGPAPLIKGTAIEPADLNAADPALFSKTFNLPARQVITRWPPPRSPRRQALFPGRSPATIAIGWRDGAELPDAQDFSTPFTPEFLCEYWSIAQPQDIEGDPALRHFPIPGDFVLLMHPAEEDFLRTVEAIMRDQMHTPIKLEFRQVVRPCLILRGTWRRAPTTAPDQRIEIADNDTPRDSAADPGARARGHPNLLALTLGELLMKDVFFDAQSLPKVIVFHWHGGLHDPDQMLRNLQEQTNLTAVQESRSVRHLFIEPATASTASTR